MLRQLVSLDGTLSSMFLDFSTVNTIYPSYDAYGVKLHIYTDSRDTPWKFSIGCDADDMDREVQNIIDQINLSLEDTVQEL